MARQENKKVNWHTHPELGLAVYTRATAAVMILLEDDEVGMAFFTLALSSAERRVEPAMMRV